jgi:glucarate dehydratase
MIDSASVVDQVLSPFEVTCLDVQGHATGRPVTDLLGGRAREAVPFSAYLFYKWAGQRARGN